MHWCLVMALLPETETSTDTRSVLHIVEENFMKLGLKTYVERMLYAGEHALPKEELIEHFRATIRDVNSGYCDIAVRGLMLVYDRYFVHVIEGSEDTIHRHLRFLFSRETKWNEKNKKKYFLLESDQSPKVENSAQAKEQTDCNMFRRLKLLMVYHSIKTLQFKDWNAVMADPPTLISKLDVKGPLSEHMEQLRICLDKLRRLGEIARYQVKLTLEELLAADPKMEFLPEVDLLDYLLSSPHLLDLRAVARMHRRVDHYTFYFEKVWPLPAQYTPRLLYKLKIDDTFVEPLPLMSWEITKETVEEEEREEMSNTSD